MAAWVAAAGDERGWGTREGSVPCVTCAPGLCVPVNEVAKCHRRACGTAARQGRRDARFTGRRPAAALMARRVSDADRLFVVKHREDKPGRGQAGKQQDGARPAQDPDHPCRVTGRSRLEAGGAFGLACGSNNFSMNIHAGNDAPSLGGAGLPSSRSTSAAEAGSVECARLHVEAPLSRLASHPRGVPRGRPCSGLSWCAANARDGTIEQTKQYLLSAVEVDAIVTAGSKPKIENLVDSPLVMMRRALVGMRRYNPPPRLPRSCQVVPQVGHEAPAAVRGGGPRSSLVGRSLAASLRLENLWTGECVWSGRLPKGG